MKIKNILYLTIIISIVIVACKPSLNSNIDSISKLEKEIFAPNVKFDSVKVKQLISMYTDFADRFPNDTSASKYLFSASRLYVSLENYQQSITLLDKIINNYPKTKIAPDCMFMKAYIYDDKIKDYKSALKFYNEFINKYPTHDLVSAAKASIGSLGVPAEVLIKGFENTKAIKVDTIR